jgi:hypothetical protein
MKGRKEGRRRLKILEKQKRSRWQFQSFPPLPYSIQDMKCMD